MSRYAVPLPLPLRVTTVTGKGGYVGTQRTLRQIMNLVRVGARDVYVRQRAIDILVGRRVRPKDYLGEIQALFEWVQANVRYTRDPYRVEVLHTPRRMLELRAGDCDDMTSLLGAMLQAIGHPVRLVIVGPDALRPRFFTHIYLESRHGREWIPLDATMPHPMGWAPWAPVKTVVAMERRSTMLAEDAAIQTISGLDAPPPWLRGLVRGVRTGGLQPRDPRVRNLWNVLRARGMLGRSPWLRRVLRYAWTQGLSNRPRPRTAARLVRVLRALGILPSGTRYQSVAMRRWPSRRLVARPGYRRLAPGYGPIRPVIRRWPARPIRYGPPPRSIRPFVGPVRTPAIRPVRAPVIRSVRSPVVGVARRRVR